MFLLVDLFAGLILFFCQFGPFLFREFAVRFHRVWSRVIDTKFAVAVE